MNKQVTNPAPKDGHNAIIELPQSDEPIMTPEEWEREWERQTENLSTEEVEAMHASLSRHIAIELLRANITILPG